MLALHYYYRFRNRLDDVVELMNMRGFHLCHQTVHNWTQTFGVELGLKLRERRQGRAGKKWHVDSPIFMWKDVGVIFIERLIKRITWSTFISVMLKMKQPLKLFLIKQKTSVVLCQSKSQPIKKPLYILPLKVYLAIMLNIAIVRI